MELLQLLAATIDVDAIIALDWKIKGPGLLLFAAFLLRAITSFFAFSPIKLVMSLIYAFIVILALSRGGFLLEQMFLEPQDPTSISNREPA